MRLTTSPGHNCIQIWPNGTVLSVNLRNVNLLILRYSLGFVELVNGKLLGPAKYSGGKSVRDVLYSSNGTQLLETSIQLPVNFTGYTMPPLFVSPTGIAAFTGSFQGILSLYRMVRLTLKLKSKAMGATLRSLLCMIYLTLLALAMDKIR